MLDSALRLEESKPFSSSVVSARLPAPLAKKKISADCRPMHRGYSAWKYVMMYAEVERRHRSSTQRAAEKPLLSYEQDVVLFCRQEVVL